ncbi:MAG: DUF362 domain-containing protein [Candidatus Alcyoniella australis]|nr:DUF362 domain-containing protein [Candidatus Alcyoniella australis]
MSKKTVVAVSCLNPGYPEAIEDAFSHFSGVKWLADPARRVLIKPNGVGFDPEHFTSLEFLEALFAHLRDNGYKRLALMENCTNGSFTRLVFAATGYSALCKRFGVEQLLLDEQPYMRMLLGDEPEAVKFPKVLHDEVLHGDAFYLNCPKFKTHSMSVVTLGVKNQQGLLDDADKMFEHTHHGLHRRLARIYRAIRPHFTLIDAKDAMRYGHFPARANLDQAMLHCGVVIGGWDTLAVDTVGAKILGYSVDEIEHLRICRDWGLGTADLEQIEIRGELPELPDKPLPYQILRKFPDNLRIVSGSQLACTEGCKGNTEVFIEYLAGDFGGKGGFTLVCGKGFDPRELDNLPPGPILVIGPCAVAEALPILRERYPRRRIRVVDEHNDLARMATEVKRLMHVNTFKLSPFSLPHSLYLLAQARLHGCRSRIPSLR